MYIYNIDLSQECVLLEPITNYSSGSSSGIASITKAPKAGVRTNAEHQQRFFREELEFLFRVLGLS